MQNKASEFRGSLFVMSKIKLSLVLNTHINLFDGKD